MTEPDHSPPGDELTERYREASAQDTRRPGAHVRDAVRAHAQMVIAAGKAEVTSPTGTVQTQAPVANQSRWKISALATVALVGLTGLLVLQFDRGSDEEKDLVFGQPSASAPPAAVPAPAPMPAPAAGPAATAPQAPQTEGSEGRVRAKAVETLPAPAVKAPAKPAAGKPAPQSAAPGQAAAKAEAETAQVAVASPPAAMPAPPAPALTQDSARLSRSTRMADATTGLQADTSAPAPAARSAPPAAPAPAPAMAAAEQRQEKSAAPIRALRGEAASSLGLASALQQAARAGDLQQLERLLQQGAPLNAADPAGRTPLILAVTQGHTAVVERLLAAGANTALIDKDGLNALQHARRLGFDGIAHLIETAR